MLQVNDWLGEEVISFALRTASAATATQEQHMKYYKLINA